MIIRHLRDTFGTEREVGAENWTSRRLLLAGDNMGFSLHDTIIKAGTATEMCYRNHLEAVYCIQGTGQIRDLATGQVHALEPGSMYALDRHDQHILTAFTEMRMVCVFNPPVSGREVHDESGAYPIEAAAPT